jgi:hypothetical protein
MAGIDTIVAESLAESKIDYVGLWEIVPRVREELGLTDPKDVIDKSLTVVRKLVEHGLRPMDGPSANLPFWPENTPDAVADRIRREWEGGGGDPNFGGEPSLGHPICWFGVEKDKASNS